MTHGWLLNLPGLRRFRTTLAHHERQIDVLRQKLDALHDRLIAERSEFARASVLHKRNQLSPGVLRQITRVRRDALQSTAARSSSLARAEAFAGVSPAYRSARVLESHGAADSATDTVLIDGLTWRIPADAREKGSLADRMLREHWLPLRDLLDARELAQGAVMLDIGANIGTTSIPRVVLGDFSYVYAAEPHPGNYACLVQNIVGNGLEGLVLPDHVAIGAYDGEATLHQAPHIGTHHLAAPGTPGDLVTVPCLTLDSWVDRIGVDLDLVTFVKVDTQGWEVRVLEGAGRLRAKPHIAWHVEFSPRLLKRARSTPGEFFEIAGQSFTHFIDLRGDAGPRVRRIADLADAMAYVERRERRYTNLLLYSGTDFTEPAPRR